MSEDWDYPRPSHMRRGFKPPPADEIADEDERCRVRHEAFVAKQNRVRKHPSDFWFVICVVVLVTFIIGALAVIFTH